MTSDLLAILGRINLAGAAAVVLVLLLRRPARRLFGAGIAYGLWSIPPLAALAMLLPARVVTVAVAATPRMAVFEFPAEQAPAATAGPDIDALALALWAAGGAVAVAHMAWRQAQFGRAVRAGRAGPAVVGVLRPRVVTPDDFDQRYSPRERLVVLAHEQAHIARHDSRINALVALARCAFWFNPFVHLLSRALRVDQELACDAQVVAAHPTARRPYAEAMLKTQLAARPLPIGCYWPAEATHPLAERVRLLAVHPPPAARRKLGLAAVALVATTAAGAAWAVRPPQVVQLLMASSSGSRLPQAPAVEQEPEAFAVRPARQPRSIAEAPPAASAVVAPAQPQLADAAPVPMPAAQLVPGSQDPLEADGRVRRIRSNAQRSSVEPGNAVRVVATTVGRDGVPFWIDLTSFGSQSMYRTGGFGWGEPHDHSVTALFERGQRHGLFTSVVQRGERLLVTVSPDKRYDPAASGAIELRSGETGELTLPDGQHVSVTATLRAETPQEVAEGEQALQRQAAAIYAAGGRFAGR